MLSTILCFIALALHCANVDCAPCVGGGCPSPSPRRPRWSSHRAQRGGRKGKARAPVCPSRLRAQTPPSRSIQDAVSPRQRRNAHSFLCFPLPKQKSRGHKAQTCPPSHRSPCAARAGRPPRPSCAAAAWGCCRCRCDDDLLRCIGYGDGFVLIKFERARTAHILPTHATPTKKHKAPSPQLLLGS